MPDKKIKFRCAHCGKDTKLIVEITANRGRKGKTIQLLRYCEHCNGLNILTVPETWEKREPTLGDDDVLEFSEDIPVIQGKKP